MTVYLLLDVLGEIGHFICFNWHPIQWLLYFAGNVEVVLSF